MEAGRKRGRQDRRLKGQEAKMMAVLDESFGPQELYLKRALKSVEHSYDAALTDLDRAEGVGLQRIGDQQKAGMGAVRSDFASSGLYGSSVMANAQRGVARDASASTIDLEGALSRMRGGIKIQQGQATANANQNLAAFQAYRANATNQVLNQRWNFIANQQYQAPPMNLSGLGQYMGSGGGGGGTTDMQNPFGMPGAF